MIKKNQRQAPDLTPAMLEMQAQLARLQAELASLKGRTHSLPQPAFEPKPKVSTTRRKLLRQLAGGLAAGLAVAGIGAAAPDGAEAKITSNPSGNGLTGRVGMLVMPPGGSVSGTMGGVAGTKVGLLVGGDTSFNLTNNQLVPTVNSAIIGYTSGGGTAVVGLSQSGIGVYGQSNSNNAVWGTSTSGYGVYGESTSGHGVYGSTSNTGATFAAGVYGVAVGDNSGVYGKSSGGNGVYGDSDNNNGVYGTTITGFGVLGRSNGTGLAGYFDGKVFISGNLTKGGGSFKIDHPLDPANKYLYHSFVESPDMMNIYNGIVTLDDLGEATIEMPDWFEALNFDFRYQLTCMDQYAPIFVAQRIKDGKFKIAGGLPGQEISWQLTGIRQDEWAKAHRIPVEEDKNDKEKGKYIHPELFGQPEEMSVSPRPLREQGR